MPDYRLILEFTAADERQAQRLGEAWAGTCEAEYNTRNPVVVAVGEVRARDVWARVDEAIDTDPMLLRDIVAELLTRAERAERERSEARTVIERVREENRLILEFTPADDRRASPVVWIDPAIRGGRPMVGKAPVNAVAERIAGGEDPLAVADDYGINRRETLLACWYQGLHDKTRTGRRLRDWAAQVSVDLARATDTECEQIPDPPDPDDPEGGGTHG